MRAPDLDLPFFVSGQFLSGQPLAWVFGRPVRPRLAKVKGRLWRLPSGTVQFVYTSDGIWIQGDLVSPDRRSLELAMNIARDELELVECVALVSARAVRALTFTADPVQLKRSSGRPLRSTSWARFS